MKWPRTSSWRGAGGSPPHSTIIDHQDVTEEDLGAQFFIAEAQSEKDVIGKNVSYNQGRTSTAMH